jgi:hypothetical protein
VNQLEVGLIIGERDSEFCTVVLRVIDADVDNECKLDDELESNDDRVTLWDSEEIDESLWADKGVILERRKKIRR